MEKQFIYRSPSKKNAHIRAERILRDEWQDCHNIDRLYRQQDNVRCLILTTCDKKTLKQQEDLSFRMM